MGWYRFLCLYYPHTRGENYYGQQGKACGTQGQETTDTAAQGQTVYGCSEFFGISSGGGKQGDRNRHVPNPDKIATLRSPTVTLNFRTSLSGLLIGLTLISICCCLHVGSETTKPPCRNRWVSGGRASNAFPTTPRQTGRDSFPSSGFLSQITAVLIGSQTRPTLVCVHHK